MSQFLTTIEAEIARSHPTIPPTRSPDRAGHGSVSPQITGLQDSMTAAATDLASVKSDLADTQKAMTESSRR